MFVSDVPKQNNQENLLDLTKCVNDATMLAYENCSTSINNEGIKYKGWEKIYNIVSNTVDDLIVVNCLDLLYWFSFFLKKIGCSIFFCSDSQFSFNQREDLMESNKYAKVGIMLNNESSITTFNEEKKYKR